MHENLRTALGLIYGSEGGYVNHPRDPGKATKYGITAATLGAARKLGRSATDQEVRSLQLAEAETIIARQYAAPIRFDDLPAGLDYAVLDFAVNSGPAQAVKSLQKILGVDQDGVIGAKTLTAIASRDANEIISAYCAYRMRFLKGLSTWSTFGNGWTKRVNSVTARAKAMVRGGQITVGALENADQQIDGSNAVADPKQTTVTSTKSGKAGVVTLLGAVGSGATDAAQQIAPYTDYLGVLKWAFAALTLVGVALGLYVTVQRIAAGNPQ